MESKNINQSAKLHDERVGSRMTSKASRLLGVDVDDEGDGMMENGCGT